MERTSENLAIMFADINDSTRLYELLGDATANRKISSCLDKATYVVERYEGKVIKTIGDELMCSFGSAEQATVAACEIHEMLGHADVLEDIEIPLSMQIGLHYGPVLLEGNDVFGDTVNIAARMVSIAKNGQSITTKDLVDQLPALLRASTRFIDRAPVRGKKDVIDIYEIIWQEDDVTWMASGILEKNPPAINLQLRYHNSEVHMNLDRPAAVMGRSKSCDITVDETLVSREHVKIECRRGKFYIIDQSTNGTYLRSPDNEEAFLRREEMQLRSQGEISLGRPFQENPNDLIFYSLIIPSKEL